MIQLIILLLSYATQITAWGIHMNRKGITGSETTLTYSIITIIYIVIGALIIK